MGLGQKGGKKELEPKDEKLEPKDGSLGLELMDEKKEPRGERTVRRHHAWSGWQMPEQPSCSESVLGAESWI